MNWKWLKHVCIACTASLIVFVPSVASVAATSNPLTGLKTYTIYYNAPNSKILKELSQYDFVIIEPHHYSAKQIQSIQASGTLVFGYISTMEAPSWNQALMKKLQSQDFMYKNEKKVHFAEWDSYLMDISSVHYQQVLQQEIQEQIVEKGFNGIFLDTVGDIDDTYIKQPSMLKSQRSGMKTLLAGIKKSYPKLTLIQNWGFATLQTTTAPYIQAVMWENFNSNIVSKDEWSLNQIALLQKLKKQYSIQVLTVSNTNKAKSTAFANKKGFIHYHDSNSYDKW